MHIPSDYEIKDRAVISAFMQQHPFAQLVCATESFPVINHLPLLYDTEQNCLRGHLAKNNPALKHLHNAQVSVVFTGPHGYISPDWYQKPGVPTWNYQAVHVQGICQTDNSTSRVKNIVDKMSALHQASLGSTWVDDYNPSMLSAIEAIKIVIHNTHCQFKLSQDRSVTDQLNVIRTLQESGQLELADAMKQVLKP